MTKAEQPTITQSDALTVLQSLSSYVGAGGLDVTDVASLDERIRWGIDVQVSVAIQRAAEMVEECSKVPSTRWGQVKAAILALDTCKQPYTRTTSLAAQDGLVEALKAAREFLQIILPTTKDRLPLTAQIDDALAAWEASHDLS